MLSFLIPLLAISAAASAASVEYLHPDAGLNISQYLDKYGYPLETHTVTTEDGYILTLHRIPHGRQSNETDERRPAVLLMHGLLSESADWINTGPEKALGLLLADAGYDVWMGNQRGNMFSRQHVTLDADVNNAQFFNFSFHEIGLFDLPAKIDYILNATQQEQIGYVGHSQGTTAFFVMAASRPEYNGKVRTMQALAPVAFMGHMGNPFLKPLAKNVKMLEDLAKVLNFNEFFPHTELLYELGTFVCTNDSAIQFVCPLIFDVLGGFDNQIDPNIIPVIVTNTPAGAAIKQIFHYFQEVNSGRFCQYDYTNGTVAPPEYNLTNIQAPISLHYSKNDWLTSVEDVEFFATKLPNLDLLRIVPYDQFNHLDYLWANNVVDVLYSTVIDEIDKKMKQ